jgi:hypothetical protein
MTTPQIWGVKLKRTTTIDMGPAPQPGIQERNCLKQKIDPAARVCSWLVFAFALLCIGVGVWAWVTAGAQDLGGVLVLFFIGSGVVLAVPSLSYALTGSVSGFYSGLLG